MAMQGSSAQLTGTISARLQYEDIDETREFDVLNLDKYDIVLGTPFLYQHQVVMSLNPMRVIIGTAVSQPLASNYNVVRIASLTAAATEIDLERVRETLKKEAMDLCRTAEEYL
ncbi:hypothetical protein M422DRAFT_267419 [Sphaerobolus stellatus SS14]|uniref:Uncharacterized protein n=1 Tax=Sphaerobolus stellatus (strain SS14) TaxID=990650 RepID=A0A0C9UPT4_SPHS4|nr:hypothetical protein M422DRAFT_267419 [Sphaerobolus stellatus SS14]